MLAPRLRPAVFIVLLTVALAFLLSLAMTVLHHRIDAWFITRWMRGWAICSIIAIPSALLIAPPLRALADRLCR